jgi:hypothetical protein
MVESGGSTAVGKAIISGLVEDVDAVHQGNGCFGAWGVSGIVFKNVRVSQTHCEGVDSRGKPSSGALVFAGGSEGTAPVVASKGLVIVNGLYNQLCVKNLVWPASAWAGTELTEGTFTPREALGLSFCWGE